jgi:hypothetical protein
MTKFVLLLVLACLLVAACLATVPAPATAQEAETETPRPCGSQLEGLDCPYMWRVYVPVAVKP